MLTHRTIYCDDIDQCGYDGNGICTSLNDHAGDHYDAATERRWYNWDAPDYSPSCEYLED